MSFLTLSHIHFSYPSSTVPLFEDLSLSFNEGWTSLTGSNGTGKTTLALIAAGLLEPDSGSITASGPVAYCPQLFQGLEVDDYAYLYDYESSSVRLRQVLGLEEGMMERVDTLSGGERKRLQVYLALSRQPSVLVLDEPTNHLDGESKALVLEALRSYDGVGLIISHDRAFLEDLSKRTLIFSRLGAGMSATVLDIPLPVQEAWEEKDSRERSLLSQRQALEAEAGRLGSSQRQLEGKVASSSSRLSKRNIDPKDHDAAGRIDAARLTGKDRKDAQRMKAIETRRLGKEAELDALSTVRLRKSGLSDASFASLHSALSVEACDLRAGGYVLKVPSIDFPPGSHSAITGVNGAGKTLLVRHVWEEALSRWGGGRCAYIKQEYGADDSRRLLEAFRALDDDERGSVVSDLFRLGCDATSFADGLPAPSPGELRKLDIVLAIRRHPALMILDEPTNHLDLTAIMSLEEILAAGRLTLVLVSHDALFRQRLCDRELLVVREGDEGMVLLSPLDGSGRRSLHQGWS